MLALSLPEYYILLVMGTALILIISNRLAPDLVALLVMLMLGLSGIISPEQALAGFSSSAVITIIGLFVITGALEYTGVVLWMSQRLARLSGHVESRMLVVFMSAGALLSLFVNNIAAGGVLLPAAVRIAHQAKVHPSKILIPLAFGTLVGGMATLFTTANIILSSILVDHGQRGLTMFDFLPVGGFTVLAGIVYMVFVGRHLLPSRESYMHRDALARSDLRSTYQLDERLWEAEIAPTSPLAGQSLHTSCIGERLGITVLAIWRSQHEMMQGEQIYTPPSSQAVLESGDHLLILGREERVRQLEHESVAIQPIRPSTQALLEHLLQPVEVIIPPRSAAIGQTLKELNFRARRGLTAVAIWRGKRSYRTDVGTMPLQAGDGLLMVGVFENIRKLAQNPGYILPEEPLELPPNGTKRHRAAVIGAFAIGLSTLGWLSTSMAMLIGAAMLVLAGCLHMNDAYRAIEWRIVFLIAGMTPISIAMQETGLAEHIGQTLTAVLIPFGPLAFVAGMYLFTMLVTQVIGGQVTALVAGPLAIAAAIEAHVNPAAVGVAVSMACSASFLTPIAHPVNLLMMNPGGYTYGDFGRVGSGMTLVCFLTLLIVMPIFWQL